MALERARQVREVAKEVVECLSVVVRLHSRVSRATRDQALERVRLLEREVHDHERVAVRGVGLPGLMEADRNLHAESRGGRAERREPAPQPAAHRAKHHVIDGRARGRGVADLPHVLERRVDERDLAATPTGRSSGERVARRPSSRLRVLAALRVPALGGRLRSLPRGAVHRRVLSAGSRTAARAIRIAVIPSAIRVMDAPHDPRAPPGKRRHDLHRPERALPIEGRGHHLAHHPPEAASSSAPRPTTCRSSEKRGSSTQAGGPGPESSRCVAAASREPLLDMPADLVRGAHAIDDDHLARVPANRSGFEARMRASAALRSSRDT